MATRASFNALSAELPDSGAAALLKVGGRWVLAFDAAGEEVAYFTIRAPQGLTGTKTFTLDYFMASATTGGVAFRVAVEAITDGDSTDMDAATSFATGNVGTAASVPGTAGYPDQISITLTNDDSMAAADYLRFSLTREVGNGSDTASGDCYVPLGEFRDAA